MAECGRHEISPFAFSPPSLLAGLRCPSSGGAERSKVNASSAADRTAPADRAHAEPRDGWPTEPRRGGHAGQAGQRS